MRRCFTVRPGRAAAAIALAVAAAGWLPARTPAAITTNAIDLTYSKTPPPVAAAATNAAANGRDAAERLIRLLPVVETNAAAAGPITVRKVAVMRLVRIGPDAVPALRRELQEESSPVAAEAAAVLGLLRARAAAPELLAGLQDTNAAVRAACAWALGRVGDASATADLRQALEFGDSETRFFVATALCQLGAVEAGMRELLLLLFAEEDQLPVNADGTYSGSLRVRIRPNARGDGCWWQESGARGTRQVFYSPRIRAVLECLAGRDLGIDAHALTQWWRSRAADFAKHPEQLQNCLGAMPDLIR